MPFEWYNVLLEDPIFKHEEQAGPAPTPTLMTQVVFSVLNDWFDHGVPLAANTTFVVAIPKGEGISDLAKMRGISLIEVILKFLIMVVKFRVSDGLEAKSSSN